MKVYSYSQARQNLAEVLDRSKREKVLIRRRGGDIFRIAPEQSGDSPFDVPPVKVKASTADILDAVREVRTRRRK